MFFFNFVKHLLRVGTLTRGDIFVVGNCTIHFKGFNFHLQDILWNKYQILMIALPPYYPEYNTTELVFSTLVGRLKSTKSRFGANTNEDFKQTIVNELANFTRGDIKRFFYKCEYYCV